MSEPRMPQRYGQARRILTIMGAAVMLGIMATTRTNIYSFERTLPPGWGAHPCETVPDFRQGSPTYGQGVCKP